MQSGVKWMWQIKKALQCWDYYSVFLLSNKSQSWHRLSGGFLTRRQRGRNYTRILRPTKVITSSRRREWTKVYWLSGFSLKWDVTQCESFFVFFSGSCRGNIFITNKYTTEVFGQVFQIIGQVMTKAMKIQNLYNNNILNSGRDQ